MSASLKSFRPMVENLEDRLALSTVSVVSGDLVIHANNASNSVTVQTQFIGDSLFYRVTDTTGGVTHSHFVAASQVTGGDVVFYGYDGNDYFRNLTGLRTTAYGMNGNDTLIGSYNNDFLCGGAGSDYIRGGYGNDYLKGEAGVDYLYGEAGNDTLDGGDDGVRDYLVGGTGADRFQRDWFWTGFSWANRDFPLDFTPSQGDSFFG